MATYIMLSRLTENGAETLRKNPGRVEAPDLGTVMKASVTMSSRGSVRIETLAAVTMDEFVRAMK